MDDPFSIPRQFVFGDTEPVSLKRIGIGHINDTYLVTLRSPMGRVARYVIQRINRKIFPEIRRLMENVERVTGHLDAHGGGRSLSVIRTVEGATFHRDSTGDCWRAFPYVEGTFTIEVVSSPAQAGQAGRAFGHFSRLLSDLPGGRLHETIPDFHNTPRRLADFIDAVEADPANRVSGARTEVDSAMALAPWAGRIVEAQASGEVPERVAHNDAKIENVLFDVETGEAVCVVDLDTVMPGTVLHDFGDLVRTAAATATEDERDLERVGISPTIFGALAEGFLSACGDVLTPKEIALLPFAGKVIAYEQALRFLTDYLLGDPYYRISRPAHNLERARNQLRVSRILDTLRDDLGSMISTYSSSCNSHP